MGMLESVLGNWVALTYLLVMLLVAFYGLHRYVLVYLYVKYRSKAHVLTKWWDPLPRVTIQLPMYNEAAVARRVIEAACQIRYPQGLLDIQVLDDSTDESVEITRAAVAEMAALGHPITLIHRSNRKGFKAGALAAGLEVARGEFVAIFDADFVPPPDVIENLIHHFVDDKVGMVQARWGHLNRDSSLLTKSQAIFLDGHFMIEHTARNRSGRFMHFNGTAGIWRKQAIIDAGGWQHDTLTEDLDLSYRAQIKGWKFVYLPEFFVPAELPPDMLSFKAQAHRWTKGSAQTGIKLLGQVLWSKHLPFSVKTEAFYHLTNTAVYPLMVILTLLIYPAFYNFYAPFKKFSEWGHLGFTLSLFVLATCSASTFFIYAQKELFGQRAGWRCLWYLPVLMAIGVGVSLNNAKAVLEAVLASWGGGGGGSGEFVRTPKYGHTDSGAAGGIVRPRSRVRWTKLVMPVLEVLMGVYMAVCIGIAIAWQFGYATIPFLTIFAGGYFYVGGAALAALLKGVPVEVKVPAPVVAA